MMQAHDPNVVLVAIKIQRRHVHEGVNHTNAELKPHFYIKYVVLFPRFLYICTKGHQIWKSYTISMSRN